MQRIPISYGSSPGVAQVWLEDIQISTSVAIDIAPAVEPVSLYVDLVEGAKADLVVVARAALIFASAIRDVAYVVDPSMDVRIELISGTESSLSLNSILKAKIADQIGRISLAALAFGIISWIGKESADYAFQHIVDRIVSHEESASIPPQQIEAIVKKTIEAFQKQGRQKGQRLFMELDTDPAIVGIGVTQQQGERPDYIVPKSDFRRRSFDDEEEPMDIAIRPQRRTRTEIETLTLVSPVLLESKRKWKFIGKEGEFGAAIKDGLFLDDVLRGKSAIPLAAGVKLEVELQTIEDPFQGAWVVQQRNVLRVRRVIPPTTQIQLTLPARRTRKTPDSQPKHGE